MNVRLKHIKRAYELAKRKAFEKFILGDYETCLQELKRLTVLPIQFNWIYRDDEIEMLMRNMSLNVFPINKNQPYQEKEQKVVLIDDFCRSFILALQYIEAFSYANYEVLYITYKESTEAQERSIISKLQNYKNVTILVVETKAYIERAREIYNAIINFQASKVFLHTTEFSDSLLALYALPTQINRYMINLSDQRFWIGATAIDYSLEFRPFGATVSCEKRGLKKEQLLYVPFYPIDDKNKFQGFPDATNGKVVIFTGGDLYKTLDPNYVYWKLIKNLLDQNPEAVVLFAIKHNIGTKASNHVRKFISENGFEDRFVSIGFRNDICEVFKHCDIFMGTCPTSGSLMSQLAALYSKPILQFYLPETSDDETEQALCYNNNLTISYNDKKRFLEEARMLIQSEIYRKEKGCAIHQAMLKPHQFNDILLDKILTHDSSDCLQKEVNHDKITERWLFAEKMGYMNTYSFIKSLLGQRLIFKEFPILWMQNQCKNIVNHYFKKK